MCAISIKVCADIKSKDYLKATLLVSLNDSAYKTSVCNEPIPRNIVGEVDYKLVVVAVVSM